MTGIKDVNRRPCDPHVVLQARRGRLYKSNQENADLGFDVTDSASEPSMRKKEAPS